MQINLFLHSTERYYFSGIYPEMSGQKCLKGADNNSVFLDDRGFRLWGKPADQLFETGIVSIKIVSVNA
jgi:hypothetical protein